MLLFYTLEKYSNYFFFFQPEKTEPKYIDTYIPHNQNQQASTQALSIWHSSIEILFSRAHFSLLFYLSFCSFRYCYQCLSTVRNALERNLQIAKLANRHFYDFKKVQRNEMFCLIRDYVEQIPSGTFFFLLASQNVKNVWKYF